MCVYQALVKKGIGHLSEKELKERNKLIQEENRRELQKVQNAFFNIYTNTFIQNDLQFI